VYSNTRSNLMLWAQSTLETTADSIALAEPPSPSSRRTLAPMIPQRRNPG